MPEPKSIKQIYEEMKSDGKKIIRVFPRRTNATPDDSDVRIRTFPGFFDEADEVHISVAFTWDIPWAEFTFPKWRNESIKAYGNAVVPQVAYQIFKTIEKYGI